MRGSSRFMAVQSRRRRSGSETNRPWLTRRWLNSDRPAGRVVVMHFRTFVLLAAALAIGACQSIQKDEPRPVVSLEPPAKSDAWIRIASAADSDRIRRLQS